MSTNPAAKIKEFDASSLEKIAYNAVSTIPTREPNDQYRLGFVIVTLLKEKNQSLEQAVKTAGARILVSESEAVKIIRENLFASGIRV
ncbi:MAG: hypothetical protein H3C35_05980 [Bacteroidetes bacterium]|nr:hypothetical protein [Bacteroidota bacterium]